MQSSRLRNRLYAGIRFTTIALGAALVVWLAGGYALAQDGEIAGSAPQAGATAQETPAWLEPRGINVVDLVGLLPEDVLSDSIVYYGGGNGLALYSSGERTGDTVSVRARFISSANDRVFCLGKAGDRDEWPTIMPAGTLRVFANGVDVSNQAASSFTINTSGLTQPVAGVSGPRYAPQTMATSFDTNGAILLPANMGCTILIDGTSGPLTAEFTLQTPRLIDATYLGSELFKFQTYIGPGNAGKIDSLRSQMQDKYGNRHDDLSISPAAATEFIWVKYPPTPVDAYGDPYTAAAGTYRIRRSNARLSVDHINTMGIPLYGEWQDADQSPGQPFLPFFTDGVAVSAPEYFVPAGIGYDPCMTNGGCPDSLLSAIYEAEMELSVAYFTVTRIGDGLTQIPLEQVGPAWTPGTEPSAHTRALVSAASGVTIPARSDSALYLPLIASVQPLPADDPADCPCGWFHTDGRMLDFVAPS